MTWHDRAACRGRTDLDWHPPPGPYGPRVESAILTCRDCPVRRDCLADADDWERTHDAHGIYGGLTASERIARRRWLARQRTSFYAGLGKITTMEEPA